MQALVKSILVLFAVVGLTACNASKQNIQRAALEANSTASKQLAVQQTVKEQAATIKEEVEYLGDLRGMPKAADPSLEVIKEAAEKIEESSDDTTEALETLQDLSTGISEDTEGVENTKGFWDNLGLGLRKWGVIAALSLFGLYLLASPFGAWIAGAFIKLLSTGFGLSRGVIDNTRLLYKAHETSRSPELEAFIASTRNSSVRTDAAWQYVKNTSRSGRPPDEPGSGK